MRLISVGMCLLILFISGCGSGGGVSISSSGTCVGGSFNKCLTYYTQQCMANNNGDREACLITSGDKCGN